jgi:hypothetical protein
MVRRRNRSTAGFRPVAHPFPPGRKEFLGKLSQGAPDAVKYVVAKNHSRFTLPSVPVGEAGGKTSTRSLNKPHKEGE